ncbi:nuclear transport factor 2 family protein [Chitinophaga pinensis]|uniref:SnoaL-like domain-containing protein n=1 Tax=Chitinophaga pinensis (strain ATCC 43595 / DSM 2588 / LMG 13176 / NBRC 15968 / NCIMB 11800 / UQM 2034) TaxID=485918 RepID=A0A979G9F1_CHIPD|nr:nuclear transport factor 2 family protein [Chitinophaga pinensis]ACU63117.1 conserved hypothetical protein [Chitinophaga pinensis DSM 2588]
MHIQELADRIALKELVDKVSILADRKDVHAQVQLFTENGISETFAGDTAILKLKGRKAMEEAFADLLKDYETVYHFNGQQQLTIDGDEATGICYCLVTLIGIENDKRIKTDIGAVYHDRFIRENNSWLIAQRIGYFNWQDKSELPLPHSGKC